MHSLFRIIDATEVRVPQARMAARAVQRHFAGRYPVEVSRLDAQHYRVAVGDFEPLVFVTDRATTWDNVTLTPPNDAKPPR